ncbi:MAG: alpha/beta fold hydrolase [Candidatus Rokubacteria bacterium]|nr:alpha/beta fold hydrolase [Candidatus Rokubacteria bacterium]
MDAHVSRRGDGARQRPFVLVHGMSHGAWAWDAVRARLERAGHRVVAPDLPGHGRRAHERWRASVDAYARAVAGAMAQEGLHDAVVVGHSMGGVVIPRVAELAPARVGHLVFLAAVVLPSGASLLETHLAASARPLLRGLAASGAGTIQYPAALEWARWLSDLPPGDPRVVSALSQMTPQPLRPWIERVDSSRFWAMRVPCTYIRCLRDVAVAPAKAAEYAARLGVTPIDLDCAHEPMLSRPDELVGILTRL